MPNIMRNCFLSQKASQKQKNRVKEERYQIRSNIIYLNNLFFQMHYKEGNQEVVG